MTVSGPTAEELQRLDAGVEALHSFYGYDYIQNYYGPQGIFHGNGKIDTIEFQYMLSLSKLLWHLNGKDFWGQGPDFQLWFWGMVNFIRNKERIVQEDAAPVDLRGGETKNVPNPK